jgi:hypothetical protein
MATTDLYTVSGDVFPTKHALRFLGGNVDDGVTVNALGAAICAGNHTQGTISAWVMIPNNYTAAMSVMSFGDNNVATEYVDFSITTAGKLRFIIVDGTTRVDVITTSKVIYPWRWYHVAVVQDAILPKIYVNGVEQALTYTDVTEPTQWFDDLDGIDNAAIGALYSNNAYTQEFMGYITEVKVWSGTTSASALTADQLKQDMTGTKVGTGLAHYSFDGDLLDDWTGGTTYQGTIVGGLIYCDANEFACRLTYGAGIPVTADNVSITVSNGVGYALVIQQA